MEKEMQDVNKRLRERAAVGGAAAARIVVHKY